MNTSCIFVALSIFLRVFYLSTFFTLREVHCSAIDVTATTLSPIIYRRYVRRRPPTKPGDQYVEEFVEIFHTQHKPPAIKDPMTDEDVDKFIYCDFHRETEECKQYWNSRNHVGPIKRPIDVKPPTVKPPATPLYPAVKTTKGSTFASTTMTSSSTTTTTTLSAPNSSATSPISPIKPTSETEDFIPRIPDISLEDYNDVDDNFDDYDRRVDYADEDDEEDQLDQEEITTTSMKPFSFFF